MEKLARPMHPYHIEPGLLARVPRLLQEEGFTRAILITDQDVYRAQFGAFQDNFERLDVVGIDPGEAQKTLDNAQWMYTCLARLEVDRNTPILVFGGGVIGDLGGYVAATYLRGLPLFGIPTSLLAMVDSSIGGKTGVDLPQGKNLVGAFYPPRQVWVDPQVLDTLPAHEGSNGMAEVIKHGLIASPELFELCRQLPPFPEWSLEQRTELVKRASRIKLDIVTRDPKEQGERAHLNLGHTLGHALETAGEYKTLSHGQAVALGMVAAMRLARKHGVLQEELALEETLQRHGLPTRLEHDLDWALVEAALMQDKKRLDGQLRFVLPVRAGEVRLVAGIPVDHVKEAFHELCAR